MALDISGLLQDGVPTVWYPLDHGLTSWNYDPSYASATYTLATAGTVYVVGLKVNGAEQISNIVYDVTTAGGTLTSGQCHVALYQAGALLASSADTATAWAGTGVITTALSQPVSVNPGIVYAAFVFNGTTGPTLAAASVRGNVNIAAASSRYGTANTGITTAMPSTLGTISALAQSPWVALS